MQFSEKVAIRDVAIYIRKSRVNETAKDLDNHLSILTDICKKYSWKYTLYKEAGSSVSIEVRPKIQKLLRDVELGFYDAVLVIDQDRLSRGNAADTDYIKSVLKKSGTFICIREKVLNLHDDNDDTLYEFNAFFAKFEYKTIVKRLRRGKLVRVSQGYWINARPPLPYEYNKANRTLVVNPKQLKLYNLILDMYINQGISLNEIAFDLNRREGNEYRTKRGGYWSNKTILDILLSEVHLGKIVVGKSSGNGHSKRPSNAEPYKKIDRSQWSIYEGKHQAVKTQEQHEQILIIGEKNRRQLKPKKEDIENIYPLTGLVRCGLCGSTIGFKVQGKSNTPYIKKCYHKNKMGKKCSNMSGNLQPVVDMLNHEIRKYYDEINNGFSLNKEKELKAEIKNIDKQIIQQLSLIDKMDTAFEDGEYEVSEYLENVKPPTELLNELQGIKKNLEMEVSELLAKDFSSIRRKLKLFLTAIKEPNLTNKEQNELYCGIIESIIYTRLEKDNRKIKVQFK